MSVDGRVTTTTETWVTYDLGTGGGSSSGSSSTGSGNPWENAKTARLDGLALELAAYQQQYDATMADAGVALNAAVQAATENYYVTLYGTTDGSGPFGAGTPAEAFSNAIDAACQSFSAAEQGVFQMYVTAMEGWDAAMMQYFMDEMMGMGGTPPDPDDPARFSKDYHVDVAALNVDFAAATGAAWVAWVSAEVAADTTREQDIINAQYDFGVKQADAGLQFAQQAIAAEDSAAKDIIDIDADFAIALVAKEGEVADAIADADLTHAQALNAAAEALALADNAASKDQADSIVAADETRANGIAAEETDLTKDLAAAGETRENETASAEANLINEEAAANVTATAMAASAATNFVASLMGAYTGYIGTATALVAGAQQGLNGDTHTEYVTATGGDPDQAAVSQGWTDYFNSMSSAAAAIVNGSAAAAAGLVNSAASADEDLANDDAVESQTLANAGAGAYTAWVSTVTAAATSATNDLADAGLTLAQAINGAVTGFLNATNSAGKTLADISVAEGASLANAINDAIVSFAHSYIGVAVAHSQDVTNEGRTAAKNSDSALTGLATGVAAEQHDLNVDGLNEARTAAMGLATVDDSVAVAEATLDAASGVLGAAQSLEATQLQDLINFLNAPPSGGATPTTDFPGPVHYQRYSTIQCHDRPPLAPYYNAAPQPTSDMRRAIALAHGDPDTLAALDTLFMQIANTPLQGVYNTTENKCFRYLDDFIALHHPEYDPSYGKVYIGNANGGVFLALKQARAGRGIAVCGSAAATGRRGCRWTFELWLVA